MAALAVVYSIFVTTIHKSWFIRDAIFFSDQNGVYFMPLFNLSKNEVLLKMIYFGPDRNSKRHVNIKFNFIG